MFTTAVNKAVLHSTEVYMYITMSISLNLWHYELSSNRQEHVSEHPDYVRLHLVGTLCPQTYFPKHEQPPL